MLNPGRSSRPCASLGRIDFDEHRLARIGATITGRVTEIDAWLGQDVKKGDVLARLNNKQRAVRAAIGVPEGAGPSWTEPPQCRRAKGACSRPM